MNTSISYDDLAPVEREVADCYAWGMTMKEIANKRKKSVISTILITSKS